MIDEERDAYRWYFAVGESYGVTTSVTSRIRSRHLKVSRIPHAAPSTRTGSEGRRWETYLSRCHRAAAFG